MVLYRGGVLEPEGTVEIKFRKRELVKAMRRLDEKYRSIYDKLAAEGLDKATKVNWRSQSISASLLYSPHLYDYDKISPWDETFIAIM